MIDIDDKTNWEVMIDIWNSGDHDIKIPIDTCIPYYKSDMKNILGKENK